MWFNLNTMKVTTFSEVVANNPNVSFTKEILKSRSITDDLANLLNLVRLQPKEVPNFDADLEIVQPDYAAVENIDGTWYHNWDVVQVFRPEYDSNGNVVKTAAQVRLEAIAAEEEQRALLAELEEANKITRDTATAVAYRNSYLEASDKYMLPDWPHATEEDKAAWVSYRQALRDLTAVEGFPYVDFPTPPTDIDLYK